MSAADPDRKPIPFTDDDERRIASAARWGLVIAIGAMISGAITCVLELRAPGDVGDRIASVVQVVIAIGLNVWLLQASLALRRVARSNQDNQGPLLVGLRKLRAYFAAQVILVALLIAIVAVAVVLGGP